MNNFDIDSIIDKVEDQPQDGFTDEDIRNLSINIEAINQAIREINTSLGSVRDATNKTDGRISGIIEGLQKTIDDFKKVAGEFQKAVAIDKIAVVDANNSIAKMLKYTDENGSEVLFADIVHKQVKQLHGYLNTMEKVTFPSFLKSQEDTKQEIEEKTKEYISSIGESAEKLLESIPSSVNVGGIDDANNSLKQQIDRIDPLMRALDQRTNKLQTEISKPYSLAESDRKLLLWFIPKFWIWVLAVVFSVLFGFWGIYTQFNYGFRSTGPIESEFGRYVATDAVIDDVVSIDDFKSLLHGFSKWQEGNGKSETEILGSKGQLEGILLDAVKAKDMQRKREDEKKRAAQKKREEEEALKQIFRPLGGR